jgi:homoserine O-acetyltransferase
MTSAPNLSKSLEDLSPARAAFIAPETKWYELPGALPLELGGRLPCVRVAYRTWGSLDAAGGNAVVVCHALTGSADVDRWWTKMFGAGEALDPERDFIVCANILGSCYGTTGPSSSTKSAWEAVAAATSTSLTVVLKPLADAETS